MSRRARVRFVERTVSAMFGTRVERVYRITHGRGTVIECATEPCARYIAALLDEHGGFVAALDRINRALGAESSPLTVYPPRNAGDVIGEVRS